MDGTVASVRSIYDAFACGDVGAVLAGFDPAIEWWEADNFLYADRNPYVGPSAVAEGVFARCLADVEDFEVVPQRFMGAGELVVVEGRYRGTMKATRRSVDAQFAHVWELRNGKVTRFRQYTDTLQWSVAAAR